MISTMWGVLWPTVGLVDEATGWRAPTGLCLLPSEALSLCFSSLLSCCSSYSFSPFPHSFSPFPHSFSPFPHSFSSLLILDRQFISSSLPSFPRTTTIIVRHLKTKGGVLCYFRIYCPISVLLLFVTVCI